jgi:peroxiredoxin
VTLALVSDRIHAAGAEVIAISVDSEERNAAMFERWPTPHVTYVSDPAAEILRTIDMFDPEDRGGIALPGLFVIDADGNEVFGYRGRDFADRTHDDDLLDVLEGNKFGAVAIGLRAEGDEAKSLAREHRQMSQSMLDAWAEINTT